MRPNQKFLRQSKAFWANVRSISQVLGYTHDGRIVVPSVREIMKALTKRDLTSSHVIDDSGQLTPLGQSISEYYDYRSSVLHEQVEPMLMDATRARQVFEELLEKLKPECPIPMNKQKGAMKNPAFFTGIINMLIEANIGYYSCDYNPLQLTTITRNNQPLRTLARRIDGAFPSTVNPVAVWEIKEYYYTTTFGSRIADGVYETLLDGMELEELLDSEGIKIMHYLMIDAYESWWNMGKSYLCRIIDMLHMGYVDEVFFGYEVVEGLPPVVREWVEVASSSESQNVLARDDRLRLI